MTFRIALLLLILLLILTSCRTTFNMNAIQVEILKPAILALPEKMDTIAIFKRDYFQSDTLTYTHINGDNKREKPDTSIHYSDLSNQCVDAMAKLLEEEGYFLKVINYRDSLNYLFPQMILFNYPDLYKQLGADVFVFLDYFKLKNLGSDRTNGFSYFIADIKDDFPEFYNSTSIESIGAILLWTLTFKGDTSIYICKQPNQLYYGNSVYPELFGNNVKHKLLLKNAAHYLGRSFAKKIIPSWETVDRTYYRSNNDLMLMGEKYFLENDLLKAAEIYNRQTTSKNRNIAAKAKYNMAVICEMEGHLEAAIDWIERSGSTFKMEDPLHQFNCEQYGSILKKRKVDTQKLDKQVRNYANQFQD